jgi:hypothetical protein
MVWVVLGVLVAFFVVAGRVLSKRAERQPHRMPYRTGHTQGMGEAPPFPHHRIGRRD